MLQQSSTPPVEPIEIPHEQTTLPRYLYKVDYYDGSNNKSSKPRPTLIAHSRLILLLKNYRLIVRARV